MSSVRPCELPEQALLRKYHDVGGHTDCYAAEVPGSVAHSAFVEAFYTTALFKVERTLLKWFAASPSTDMEARQLALGTGTSFAVWGVEARDANQLLVRTGRTRSWLMVSPSSSASSGTRLYFGSAVVPRVNAKTGKSEIGFVFRALLGFHKLYSRALLAAARRRVLAAARSATS